MHSAAVKRERCTEATSLLTELTHPNEKAPPERGFLQSNYRTGLISADAPDATGDLH